MKISRVWVGSDNRYLEEKEGIHVFFSKVEKILSSKKIQKMGSEY